MKSMNIILPDGISESEAKLLLAIKLYEQGRVSSGKAAELAGYSKGTFLEVLSKQGIHVFDSDVEELVDDLNHA